MKLILDTHALIWWWKDDRRLSLNAHTAISDAANEVFVSSVSIWEIATKHRLGKLPEADGLLGLVNETMMADKFVHLPLNWRHSMLAGQYLQQHADPFDRMFAAQSQIENAFLVSKDEAFAQFNIKTLW